MFGALVRWVKALGYLITGRLDAARKILDTNPHVMRAKFEEIIMDKTRKIQQYKNAVAGLIAQQEKKMAKVKTLSEELGKLEKLKAGAMAKAKTTIESLKAGGATKEDIQKDGNYQKCLAAFNDFSTTINEKTARIHDLEIDIQGFGENINQHKVQLEHLVRDIEKLKAEAADSVADLIAATQEREIADSLAGISSDGTSQELERLRDLREEVKAEARISKEIAGTDTLAQEAEFLAYAASSEASSEFDALIGLADETDSGSKKKVKSKAAKESLPE